MFPKIVYENSHEIDQKSVSKIVPKLMPGSLQILVSSFLVSDFLCDGFRLQGKSGKTFKNVNKHFHNFIGQNQQKTKSENGMKSSLVPKMVHDISIPE